MKNSDTTARYRDLALLLRLASACAQYADKSDLERLAWRVMGDLAEDVLAEADLAEVDQ
jgi:hypothetical protein